LIVISSLALIILYTGFR